MPKSDKTHKIESEKDLRKWREKQAKTNPHYSKYTPKPDGEKESGEGKQDKGGE